MDELLLRLAKDVTDHMEIEYRNKVVHAYLRLHDTEYGYDTEVGGAPVLKAMLRLKQYIEAVEHDAAQPAAGGEDVAR